MRIAKIITACYNPEGDEWLKKGRYANLSESGRFHYYRYQWTISITNQVECGIQNDQHTHLLIYEVCIWQVESRCFQANQTGYLQTYFQSSFYAQFVILLKLLSGNEGKQSSYLLRNAINSLAFLCFLVLPFLTSPIALLVTGFGSWYTVIKGKVFKYSKKRAACFLLVSMLT